MSRCFYLLILLIGLFSPAVVNGQDEDDDYILLDDCPDLIVACSCGIGDTANIKEVKQKQFAVRNELGDIECVSPYDPFVLCANYSCMATSNRTETKIKGPNQLYKKRNIVQSFYPHEIHVPREGNTSLARSARQAEPCSIPTLKNAEIKCWKWPNWINCDVSCIFGYALAGKQGSVKSANMNCRLTENQWKPHGFEDCQPYVNCKAHLTKPGDLKCKEPTDGPAYCEISCLDYDQYEATPLQKYECVDEGFAKTLPHCAVLTDVPLVHKPAK